LGTDKFRLWCDSHGKFSHDNPPDHPPH
jgi:hypothetical protein